MVPLPTRRIPTGTYFSLEALRCLIWNKVKYQENYSGTVPYRTVPYRTVPYLQATYKQNCFKFGSYTGIFGSKFEHMTSYLISVAETEPDFEHFDISKLLRKLLRLRTKKILSQEPARKSPAPQLWRSSYNYDITVCVCPGLCPVLEWASALSGSSPSWRPRRPSRPGPSRHRWVGPSSFRACLFQ